MTFRKLILTATIAAAPVLLLAQAQPQSQPANQGGLDPATIGKPLAECAQRPHERLTVGDGHARAAHGGEQLGILGAGHHRVRRGDADVFAAALGDRGVHPVECARVVDQRQRDAEQLCAGRRGGRDGAERRLRCLGVGSHRRRG